MHNQIVKLPNSEVHLCGSCGERAVRTRIAEQKFCYGNGKDSVELSARVPVRVCQACGDQYTDEVAEQIRHAAVCKHLGRLSPEEIIGLRKSNDATQSQWADVTGFGIASVKRWEGGNLIQSESADKFMRLLRDRKNYDTLKNSTELPAYSDPKKIRFRTTLSQDTIVQATTFRLRTLAHELKTA